MSNEFERAVSQKQKPVIYYQNYIFNFRSNDTDGGEIYRCQNRSCRAHLKVFDESIALFLDHSHPNSENKIKKIKLVQAMRNRGKDGNENAQDIILSVLGPIENNKESVYILPMMNTIADTITRDRNKLLGFNPREKTDIPDFLKFDRVGNPFIRFDSGLNDPNRFLVFIHNEKLKKFKNSFMFSIDGTFRTTPDPFYQMLVIHTHFLGKAYPYIYVLMSSKSENDYNRVFTKVVELSENTFKYVVIDFEKALFNSITYVLEAKVFFCYFHYGQLIWRKIQNLGLSTQYSNNVEFHTETNKILLLAFLNPDKVSDQYLIIKNMMKMKFNFSELESFFVYFEKYYVGTSSISLGEEPVSSVFNKENWSVYGRQLLQIPRINNGAEGWHRGWNAAISIAHPNIAKFINVLLDQEQIDLAKLLQIEVEKNRWQI